jgi:hypothetical protein
MKSASVAIWQSRQGVKICLNLHKSFPLLPHFSPRLFKFQGYQNVNPKELAGFEGI